MIEAAKRLIYWAVQQEPKPQILVSIGRYLGKPEDYTLTELSYPLRFALKEGLKVKILFASPADPVVAVDSVTEALSFFGLGTGAYFPRVYDPAAIVDEPQKILQVGDWTLHIWSRDPQHEEREAAVLKNAYPDLYREHFHHHYDKSPPLVEFFDNTLEGHIQLEESMLAAESKCEGRHLIKRSINSLMVPYDDGACWDWEKTYLERKYQGHSQYSGDLLEQFRELKRKRVNNLMRKLARFRCFDICSEKAIRHFLLHGGLLTEDESERDANVPVRLEVVKQMIWWLTEFDHYELALVPESHIGTNIFFEVAAKDSAFIQVIGYKSRNYHLRIHGPRLREALEGDYLNRWQSLPARFRARERTMKILHEIKGRLMNFM